MIKDNIKILFQESQLLFQVFLLIILNYLSTRYLYQTFPPKALYTQNSIFMNLYKYSSFSLILFMIAPIFLYKLSWNEVINKKYIIIKYFLFFIFFIYAWGVITLDYNLYFNNAYNIDRIVLLVLFILSFRSPMLLIYFIIFSLIFYNQVSYPNFDCLFPKAYVNVKPLLEVLILFSVFIFLKKLYNKFSILSFLIVIICFHAANYFIPGLGKIHLGEHYIDWIWVNNLGNILIAKYSQGWLSDFVSIDQIQMVVGWINTFIIPMQFFAFSLQIIVLFVLIKKRLAIILFISFEFLHIGIFITSGIFFWRWILLNIAIVYIINKLNSDDIKKVFNYKVMLLSLPFIFLGNGFFHAYNLSWYDTPLNNFHQIYVTTEDGRKHKIDVNLFAPYKRVLYINTFNCFIDKPLKSRWDTVDSTIMKELTAISKQTNPSSIKETIYNFEQKYGVNEFDKVEQEKITNFLKIFFKNLNNYQNKQTIWSYISPIRHIYLSFNWDAPLSEKSKIKEVEIVFYKNFYDHHHNKLIFLEEESIIKIPIKLD